MTAASPPAAAVPDGWYARPAWALLAPEKRQGYSAEVVLSVYRDHGVVPKDSRDDNFNRTPEDLESYQLVDPGDVVFNKMKSWSGSVGVSGYRGIVSPDYMVCRIIDPSADRRFVHYLLRSHAMFSEYRRRSRGIRPNQWRLYFDELRTVALPIPPVEDQRRIADMLDAETARIDALIQKNERVLGLLGRRRERVLEDAVYASPAPPVGIHYLATYINGFPFKPEDWSDQGTPIVRIAQLLGDTREQHYYDGVVDAYCHIDSGDLIFSWSASLAARIWEGGPAYLNQHLFRVVPNHDVDKRWLLHALNAAVPRMRAIMHGSTMTHITRPMMSRIAVPKPPGDRQRAAAAHIDEQFEMIGDLEARVTRQQELLRLRRQALITAAVTGEIEV